MNAKNKPNGHGALLATSGAANGGTISLRGMGRAASDDAREFTVATSVAASAAASAEREACAEVAQAPGEGEQLALAGAAPRSHNETAQQGAAAEKDQSKVGRGRKPLPIDGEAFVDAVHSRVDLVKLEVKLLNSEDEKIVQRELACLRELRYGKRAPVAEDDAPQVILNMQRPERESL